MNKNKMLRLASVLLILTLLTTSIIGGTFAMYVTTDQARDTARVAKWGVVVTTSGSLYSDAYADATSSSGNLPTAWTNSGSGISVAATTANDNVVAPGTKSYDGGLSFGISGNPEVAVDVKTSITAEDIYLKAGTYGVLVPAVVKDMESLREIVKANNADGVYWSNGSDYTKVDDNDAYDGGRTYFVLANKVTLAADYFPVVYTLKDSGSSASAKTAVGIAEKLADAVKSGTPATESAVYKATYAEISQRFNANTDLGTKGPNLKDEKLTWEWEYTDDKGSKDLADTILGDLIAARGASPAVDYVVVSVGADGSVKALTFATDADDYTVKSGTGDAALVVANLRTKFDISLTVTQVD